MNNELYIDEAIRNYIESLIVEYNINRDEIIICKSISGKDLRLPSNEYVLVRGPEILLTCKYMGETGQVFTVKPGEFRGTISEILSLNLSSIYSRSIFYAFSNALLKKLGIIKNSIHCKGEEPIKCGRELADYLAEKYGFSKKVLHIGYQPGHIEELYKYYRDNLLITDLRQDTVWRIKNNKLIYDGIYNEVYIGLSDIVLVTASSITNSTFWNILSSSYLLGKDTIMYGVSAGAVYHFINKYTPFKIELFCPYSR